MFKILPRFEIPCINVGACCVHARAGTQEGHKRAKEHPRGFVPGSSEPPEFWVVNLGSPQEHQGLLTIESFVHTLLVVLKLCFLHALSILGVINLEISPAHLN